MLKNNQIYIARTDMPEDEALFEQLLATVSPERKQRIGRLRSADDKRRSLAAELLLQKALGQLGITKYTIARQQKGKPYFTDLPLCFSLSHCDDTVMCALSDKDIGCDVQRPAKVDIELARRFFHNDEYQAILKERDPQNRQKLFFRFWTLKESFIKATGEGLSRPLDSFVLNITAQGILSDQKGFYFKEYNLGDGNYYAVCAKRDAFETPQLLSLF